MLPRRTFIVRFLQPEGVTILENVATGERVQLHGFEGLDAHLGRWLDSGEADEVDEPETRGPDDR